MRILVVDDSESIRQRLRELIGQAPDREVREASSGALALEICDTTPVDVVLLDIASGESNQFDLIGRLRASAPRARLIVLTNNASDAHRRECLLRGADHFFDKSRQFELAIDIAVKSTP